MFRVVNIAHPSHLSHAASWRRIPAYERRWLTTVAEELKEQSRIKSACLRAQGYREKCRRNHEKFGSITTETINVGTLTVQSKVLANVLKRRRTDIACIQETKWEELSCVKWAMDTSCFTTVRRMKEMGWQRQFWKTTGTTYLSSSDP